MSALARLAGTFFGLILAALLGFASLRAAAAPLIVVDVGHSLKRPGATSARGASEYSFNKELAARICLRLQENGFPNARCVDDAARDTSPARRAENAAAAGAALLISVHHDAVQPHYLEEWIMDGKKRKFCDRFQGFSLFYSHKNPAAARSLALAKALGERLAEAGLTPTLHHAEPIPGENRELVDARAGVYRFDDLLILKRAAMPAILLEAGVILHRDDELACLTPERRDIVAMAVVRAVQEFFQAQR